MSPFAVYSITVFASGFALRMIDPIVLPIAAEFGMDVHAAALLASAFAVPYAAAQLFLGPLGDRLGKLRLMQVCCAVMTLLLLIGALAPGFHSLFASRVVAGCAAGGLIPLVLASVGEEVGPKERQAAIGRMLLAIISGQMVGSFAAGMVAEQFGWRATLSVAVVLAVIASVLLWRLPRPAPRPAGQAAATWRAPYAEVFANPRAPWLLACGFAEGLLFFSVFPFMAAVLGELGTASALSLPVRVGLVLGAFGVGGLLYALMVKRILAVFKPVQMVVIGAAVSAACYAFLVMSPHWGGMALLMFVAGFAFYMVHNNLQFHATELAPRARATGVSLFACAFFAGQGAGPVLFALIARPVGIGASLWLVSLGLLALGWCAVRRVMRAPAAHQAVPG